MNFKTTYILAIVLVVVVGVFYFASRRQVDNVAKGLEEPSVAAETGGVERPLLDADLGEITRITCEVPGEQPWVFERAGVDETGLSATWRMTKPYEANVQDWMVRNVASKLTGAKYAIVYKAGQQGGVTADDAKLNPPRAIVTLTDEAGKSATVHIGRDASASTAYVQKEEGGDIYVVNASLKHLVKDHAREYRDLRLLDFSPVNCVRLEITRRPAEGEPVEYTLVKRGTGWDFESPFQATAVAARIREFLAALTKLRATAWVADSGGPSDLYGLETPELRIRATEELEVKAEPEADDDGEKASPSEPKVKTNVYEIAISRLSPLGSDDMAYLQTAGDPAVATVRRDSVDKLAPDPNEWRDMRVTLVPVMQTKQIELNIGGTVAALDREGSPWHYADGSPADVQAVTELLSGLKDLKAQSFVDGADADPDSCGLTSPAAELVLTYGADQKTERIAVGDYTDPRTKRLRYIQSLSAEGVAKVLASAVEPLLRDPMIYRDRQVFQFPVSEIEQITVERPDPVGGEPFTFSLAGQKRGWTMLAPRETDSDAEAVKNLFERIASLRAEGVEPPDTDPGSLGLDDTAVTISLTRRPPESVREVEPEAEGEEGESGETQPARPETEPVQPPAQTYKLLVSEHEGTAFAKRYDSPTVYRVDSGLWDAVLAEYRARKVFAFDEPDVTAVIVVSPDGEDGFAKVDDQWRYAPEPDIPVDDKKVKNYVIRVGDLALERYAAYDADPSTFGLDEPQYRVTVEADGEQRTLLVAAKTCDALPGDLHYASLKGNRDVFLISPSTIKRFTIALAEFEPAAE